MDLPEIIIRCQAACEAEAVSRGFPAEAGKEILDGCIADDLDEWSNSEFEKWSDALNRKWVGKDKEKYKQLWDLYEACNNIMGLYGELVQK